MAMRIHPGRRQSREQQVERIRAAGTRARERMAAQDEASGVKTEVDIAHAPLSWWRARWNDPVIGKAIRRQFIENFIHIRDEFDKNEVGEPKLKLLKFNDAQADFHQKRTGKDAVLKGRKNGFSTYFIASDFSDAVVLSGQQVRNAVHDPDLETEFREKQFVMYENLAPHLRPATREYSDDQIWFDDPKLGTTDSHLVVRNVAAGHEGKGRGKPFTRLRLTEIPHWKGKQKKIVNSLLDAGPSADKSMESTAFGRELFCKTYEDGKKGIGGWTSHCYYWWWMRQWRLPGARFQKARGQWVLLKPHETLKDIWRIPPAGATEATRAANRARFDAAVFTLQEKTKREGGKEESTDTEEFAVAKLILAHLKALGYVGKKARWNCDEVAEYLAWRRDKIADIGLTDFKVEYPENDIECFLHSGRPVIAPVYLKKACRPSQPIEGHTYIMGLDSSLGRAGGNPGGIAVIDVDLGRMAHAERGIWSPDQMAYRGGELSDHYNGAFMVPEANNTGYALISALCDLGYGGIDRLYRHLDAAAMRRINDGSSTLEAELEKAPFGFPTTFKGYASKSTAAQKLEESIRKSWLEVLQLFIDEALVVMWNDNETFGPLAGQGHHADVFMATLIANFVMRMRATLSGGFVGVMPETGYAR